MPFLRKKREATSLNRTSSIPSSFGPSNAADLERLREWCELQASEKRSAAQFDVEHRSLELAEAYRIAARALSLRSR